MCEREKRKNEQEYSQTRGFRNKHDSRIFVEPYDFFHVFSGIDFLYYQLKNILNALRGEIKGT